MTTIRARFTTPTITATPAALETLATAGIAPAAVLARHFAGEWGGQPDNAARNEEYLASGEGMLLSVFADVPGLVPRGTTTIPARVGQRARRRWGRGRERDCPAPCA